MEQNTSTKKPNYIIISVVAIVVIAIIVGAYKFDNRFASDADVLDFASSSLDFASTTASSSISKSTAASKGSSGNAGDALSSDSSFIRLESVTLTAKSDTGNWNSYSNSIYKFSLKYPKDAEVRKFIDGKNEEYGVAFTLNRPSSVFTEKYFELTTDTTSTNACDELIAAGAAAKSASIGSSTFIRRNYSDGSSRVVEYTSKIGKTCYRGYLRLNGATSFSNTNAQIDGAMQELEDIMSTFVYVK